MTLADIDLPPLKTTLIGVAAALVLQGALVALVIQVIRHRVRRRIRSMSLVRLPATPWVDSDALVLLGVFIGAQFLGAALGLVLERLVQPAPEVARAWTLALETLLFPLAGLATILIIARRRGVDLRALYGTRQASGWFANVGWGGLYYLAMLPLVGMAAFVSNDLLRSIHYPLSPQPILDVIVGTDYPLWLRIQIIVVAVTIVPIVEETIFRGVFLPLALRRVPPRLAVAATAFIFAALHMHIPSVAPLFVLACAFSLAFLETGSLTASITMHALFNGISIAVLLLTGSMTDLLTP